MDMQAMHAKQQHYIDCIERLNGGAIDRLEWEKLYGLLDQLTEDVPLVLHPLTPSSKFARGRVMLTAEKFDSIRTLSYPSKEACKSRGRCNKPGKPVLYAGVGTELVFSEIGAKQGDIVGLLHMSPTKELYCVRLGALNLWRRTSGECLAHDDIKARIREIYQNPANITAFLLDAFVSDYFSRQGDHVTYKLTSAYTSVVLNARPDIAGLVYDSVDHTAGACLAIKPEVFDAFLQPTEVQIVKITSYLGYGVFDFEELTRANKFDGDVILWD